MYGNPEVTPGGRALKFYSSLRIEVRKAETLKQGTELVGTRTRAKIVKNKLAPPFKEAEFDIIYGEGISYEGSIIDMGDAHGILTKSGTWYSYGDVRLGQGKENVREFLKNNQEIRDEIHSKIMDKVGISQKPVSTDAKEAKAKE